MYLEQEVAHLSQTGFGTFLEAVQVVSGQDTKALCEIKMKQKIRINTSGTIIQMADRENKEVWRRKKKYVVFLKIVYFFLPW